MHPGIGIVRSPVFSASAGGCKKSVFPKRVRIAPQGHFFALRAQGVTACCASLTTTVVVGTPLHPAGFLCHSEERSDVTIRFPCGSYLPHRHYLKEYGLSRLAAQASQ